MYQLQLLSPTNSVEVLAISDPVASLVSQYTAFAEGFDAVEARIETNIDHLVYKQSTIEHTLATLIVSHHPFITTATSLAEKIDVSTREFCCIIVKETPTLHNSKRRSLNVIVPVYSHEN